jgi:rubrerythrin
MKVPKGSRTEENIFKTYQTESRDKWIYKAFAEAAEKEGKEHIAKLFRATAESEDIRAHTLLRALHETSKTSSELWMAGGYDPKKIKNTTAENLKEAIDVETREFSELYPQMIRDAENDGWSFAKECFTYASAVDEVHAGLFKSALKTIDKRINVDYYVCEACGNTIDNRPSGSCKVCGSSESSFKMVK